MRHKWIYLVKWGCENMCSNLPIALTLYWPSFVYPGSVTLGSMARFISELYYQTSVKFSSLPYALNSVSLFTFSHTSETVAVIT